MNLGDIRTYVRTFLDVDSEELPDSLLDEWVRSGFRRVTRRELRWPWLKKSWNFTPTSGTPTYELGVIADDLESVEHIADDLWDLVQIQPSEAEWRYGPKAQYQIARPQAWSQWGDGIRFWPIPDGNYPLVIRGYRSTLDWISAGAGAEPDCPADFHSLIATYALARAYEQQSDPESAAVQMNHFEQEMNELHNRYMRDPVADPMVFAGRATRNRGGRPTPLFPWEGF